MNAGQQRGDPRALILIAFGVVWLLVESGWSSGALASGLGFYWPLLVVGLGVDLLGVQRLWRLPYTVLAAGLVVVGILVAPAPAAGRAVDTFREAVAPARFANVNLTLTNVPTVVSSLSDTATLIEARVEGRRPAAFDVQGSDTKTISVRPEGGRTRPTAIFTPNRWRIGLGRGVPIDLNVTGGSGSVRADLSHVDLASLRAELGSGPTTLTLPDAAGRYRVTIDGGSGAAAIRVASGASLDLGLTMGSGRTTLDFGAFSAGRVTLRPGSGPVDIDVPNDAAVRLEVTRAGSGRLRLARFLTRQSGTGDTGVWASQAALRGGPAIDIVIPSAGSGGIWVH
ncbi:MAG: hypothetical protein P8Z81_02100 [Deinococcales bacterium]